ncbi:hypothetical protein [Paraburkholderia sp. JHI869]|uniref:hypothetical protein n=1 Tax=Paraburkholderia sp. JHI869 TaxID=3112959 RepID=UPI00317A4713
MSTDTLSSFDERGNQLTPSFVPKEKVADIVGHPNGHFARLLVGACGIDTSIQKVGD